MKKTGKTIHLICYCIMLFLSVFISPLSAQALSGNVFSDTKIEFGNMDSKNTDDYFHGSLTPSYPTDEPNSSPLQAIDISGTWTGKGGFGTSFANFTFNLIQEGDNVTGTYETPGAYPTICGLWTGTVNGNVSGKIFPLK